MGKIAMIPIFQLAASTKSNRSSAKHIRDTPHPGQYSPVMA